MDFVVYYLFEGMDYIFPMNACTVSQTPLCDATLSDLDISSYLVKRCYSLAGYFLHIKHVIIPSLNFN